MNKTEQLEPQELRQYLIKLGDELEKTRDITCPSLKHIKQELLKVLIERTKQKRLQLETNH